MEKTWSISEAINEYTIVSKSPLLPAFQIIQQCKNQPAFLTFPALLTSRHQHHFGDSMSAILQILQDCHVIPHKATGFSKTEGTSILCRPLCVMQMKLTTEVEQLLKVSSTHVNNGPSIFLQLRNPPLSFWFHDVLPWLERQWCLNGTSSIQPKGRNLRRCVFLMNLNSRYSASDLCT